MFTNFLRMCLHALRSCWGGGTNFLKLTSQDPAQNYNITSLHVSLPSYLSQPFKFQNLKSSAPSLHATSTTSSFPINPFLPPQHQLPLYCQLFFLPLLQIDLNVLTQPPTHRVTTRKILNFYLNQLTL